MAASHPFRFASWALGLCSLASCHDAGALAVTLVECDEVRGGPVCLLAADKRALRLVVETTPGSELTLELDGRAVPLTCDGASGEADSCIAQAAGSTLAVRLPADRGQLRVVAKTPGLAVSRKYDIALAPTAAPPPWLAAAAALRKDRTNPRPHEAELLVREHLRPDAPSPLSTEEQARAYSELGRSLQEQLRLGEAEAAFQEAIRLDDQAGLLWHKAADLVVLSDILFDQRRLFKLEQLLYDNQDLFNLMGRWRPWPALYRAQNAYTLGDLEQALRHLDEADQINQLCGDERSITAAMWWRSSVRAALGQEREDRYFKEAAKGVAAYPCRLGLLYGRQAELRLALLASELGEGVAPDEHALRRLGELWQRWESEPVPAPAALLAAHGAKLQALLDQSMKVLKEGCPIKRHFAQVLLSQAHLALLVGDPTGARTRLAEVSRVLAEAQLDPEQLPQFSVEWNRLSAQLARAEGRHDDALHYTDRLLKYTGDDVGSFEIQWTMLMGRALALIGKDKGEGEAHREEALDALRTANAVIEDASRSAPLLLVRGPLLGRFEWGSRLLLEVLLRIDAEGTSHASQKELREAMQLMRHLRTRPLLGLKRVELIGRLAPAERQQWTAAVVQYLSARREHEEAQSAGEAKARIDQLKEQVQLRLAGALGALRDAEPLPPRPPAQGEVFLICHPLYSRWACLAADEQQLYVHTLRADELPRAALAEPETSTFLAPFAAPLARAKVLSVFGYGDFRSVPVDRLHFAGRPLGEQLAVRYSLDIATSAVPVKDRRAVVAIDAKLEYAETSGQRFALGAPLLSALQPGGLWRAELKNLGLHGAVGGEVPQGDADLRPELSRAGLLLLFGHMDYAPGSGWINGINWTQWSRLTGGDVMLAEGSVPERVLLIACSSGAADDLVGGHEALGLAQAFLLRGSREVLATTRPVTAEAGRLVAAAVLSHLAVAPEDSLAGALRAATAKLAAANSQESIERTHGDGPPERELRERVFPQLDAFRVITP